MRPPRQRDAPPADILVVDDNKPNLAAIEVALGDLGRRLVKAASGEEALRHLLTRDFALIILDVQMPHMDGFETARLIRERKRSRHVPIIFITAHNRNDEQVLEAYRLGASDFMFKPIVPEVLRAKAKVFVDLQDRTAENERQGRLLAEMERRDIERKAAMERERWEAELLREESRQKDEFLAVLAHELRNPLSPIVTGIQLLKPYAQDNEKLDRVRDMMERQSHHLIRLIDDLLDVARISSGKIHVQIGSVDLGGIVTQAVDSVRSLIDERRHTLKVEQPDTPLTVAADPVRLTQVVANLLNNAARYTDPGGRITLSCARDGDDAVIRVADNGRGIAPQMLNSIFDRFVQEDGGTGGLGLGLALVQRLVAMHGGRVRAHSEGRGKGSEFCVWIPLADSDTAAAGDETPATVEGNDETELSIVLIEDEEDIRTSLCALLEGWGHKVKVAGDGAKGLKLIARHKPHAAIIDIAMPGIDGYEVARRIRANKKEPCPRLIAMTGFGRDRDREKALRAGFDRHITKPARPEDLQRALRE